MPNFYDYFKANMNAMGLPCPDSLFADLTTALATIKSIQAAITVGGNVTIAELIGAGTLSEGLAVAGGVAASFYLGACIGSLAVATGYSLADLLSCADDNGIDRQGWSDSLASNTYLNSVDPTALSGPGVDDDSAIA